MASINHPIAGDLSYGSMLLGADFPWKFSRFGVDDIDDFAFGRYRSP